MDPNQRIISLSSDSDQSNVLNPTYPETQKRPTKSPFAFSSDEETDEEVTSPTPAQASDEESDEEVKNLNWMTFFPPSTSMPFYDPGVPLGSYFPSQPVEEKNEEEALEIPPLAIVYPGEEIPSEVGCSKKSSSKKSKKAKPVMPPKTGRGKGKKKME